MQFSRREFLGGTAAAMAAAFVSQAWAAEEGKPLVKLALMSDPHVTDAHTQEELRKAFAYAASQDVDGVLVAGDLANNGRDAELKMFADAWFSVFPNSRNARGEKVTVIGCYGNRDYRRSSITQPGQREAEKDISIFSHPDAIWNRLFGEPIGDEWCVREIKGHKVVVAHWGFEKQLKEWIGKTGVKADETFFYVQHPHPGGTVFAGLAGTDKGPAAVLAGYPNCIALSGHSHRTITSEHALWRGSFTSIAGGSTALVSAAFVENYENTGAKKQKKGAPPLRTPHMPVPAELTCGGRNETLILSLYADHMTVARHENNANEMAGPTWRLARPFQGDKAQPYGDGSAGDVPQFPVGAKISVAERKGVDRAHKKEAQIAVSLPAAIPAASVKGRVMDYEVCAVKDGQVVARELVVSLNALKPMTPVTKPVVCVFGRDEIPDGVTWRATPRDYFGRTGKPIEG